MSCLSIKPWEAPPPLWSRAHIRCWRECLTTVQTSATSSWRSCGRSACCWWPPETRHNTSQHVTTRHNTSQHVTMCHNISQCVTMCHDVSQCVTMCHNVSQCVTMCHSMSQHVTKCGWWCGTAPTDLAALDADDAVRVATAVVVEGHVDRLPARRQPFLLRVRIDLEDVSLRRVDGLLPVSGRGAGNEGEESEPRAAYTTPVSSSAGTIRYPRSSAGDQLVSQALGFHFAYDLYYICNLLCTLKKFCAPGAVCMKHQ